MNHGSQLISAEFATSAAQARALRRFLCSPNDENSPYQRVAFENGTCSKEHMATSIAPLPLTSFERNFQIEAKRAHRAPLRQRAQRLAETPRPVTRINPWVQGEVRALAEEKPPRARTEERSAPELSGIKTITEYRPLIFGEMLARAERRGNQRKRRRLNVLQSLAYGGIGMWLAVTMGLTLAEWQFWLVFAPFFGASELALWQISRS